MTAPARAGAKSPPGRGSPIPSKRCASRTGSRSADPGEALRGTLRPYQRAGVEWLYLLTRLGLGACLADDMGLGKTIQVLSLLLVLKQQTHKAAKAKEANGKGEPEGPSLLIAPASLLANWAAEIAKFAPSVNALVAHPSAIPAGDSKRSPKTG